MYTLLHSVPPTLHQATADSCLQWRLLVTHGHAWVSFLCGHCSFLLGPGAHKVLFVPSKSLFPQSCVSSGGSVVGLMVTSSKRAYASTLVFSAPDPAAGLCQPMPLLETPGLPAKCGPASCGVAAPFSWVLVHTRFCLCPPRVCFPSHV